MCVLSLVGERYVRSKASKWLSLKVFLNHQHSSLEFLTIYLCYDDYLGRLVLFRYAHVPLVRGFTGTGGSGQDMSVCFAVFEGFMT